MVDTEKIKLAEIQMETKTCEDCGAVVKTLSWARHILTKKHKKGAKIVTDTDVKPFECRRGNFKVSF